MRSMGAVGKSKGVWSRVVVPTPQDLKMGIPNVLVLLTSYLLLPADVTADFDDGYSDYKTGDYETALREFKASAEQRDAVAQFNVAVVCDKGEMPQDYFNVSIFLVGLFFSQFLPQVGFK